METRGCASTGEMDAALLAVVDGLGAGLPFSRRVVLWVGGLTLAGPATAASGAQGAWKVITCSSDRAVAGAAVGGANRDAQAGALASSEARKGETAGRPM